MTRRLRIVHRSGLRYRAPVAASYNRARMTPVTTLRQNVLDATVRIDPVTWTHAYQDYWGTRVTGFEVLVPHQELTVISRSTVEVGPGLDLDGLAGWDDLRRESVVDEFTEYLTQTVRTNPAPEVVGLAREAAAGLAPDAAARAVCEALRNRIDYRPGVTGVSTGAGEVWAARQGVCQDFAHVTLGALRALGIPARYVSGYLHPLATAEVGEAVEGQSHAWIEWWAGEWTGFDPTSLTVTGQDHVVVARARDYVDVSPLEGVYAGTSGSQLLVSVEVTRIT